MQAFAALLLTAAAALTSGPALAQPTVPAPERPPPATPVPLYPPTPLPKDQAADEDEEEADAPPPAPAGSATPQPPGFVLPARTQRPTRTPRATALPSATPLAAGGLRLTFSASPAVLVLREPATFTLDLVNQGDLDIVGLVIDVAVPDVLITYDAQARLGEISRSGGLLSWHLPRFATGERSSLRLSGSVARAGGERTGICASVISSGAALEHCASYQVLAGRPARSSDVASPPEEAIGDALPAPSGVAALRQFGRPGLLAGFGLLLVGIALLGAWWTRTRLSPRRMDGAADEAIVSGPPMSAEPVPPADARGRDDPPPSPTQAPPGRGATAAAKSAATARPPRRGRTSAKKGPP